MMLRRRHSPAVMLVVLSLGACGQSRTVIERGGGATGGDIGDGGSTGKGGATGTGGSASSGSAGAGGAAASGGKRGGAAGLGGSGGGPSVPAGTGGVGGAVVTFDPEACHVTAVAEPSDATAREQWSLAKDYCRTLGEQGCLEQTSVLPSSEACTPEERVEQCVDHMLWSHHANIASAAPQCEDAWRADLACGAAATFSTPSCEGAGVFGYTFGERTQCADENGALLACVQSTSDIARVDGTFATCFYTPSMVDDSSCVVSCQMGAQFAYLECEGPAGLAKQCSCSINGHMLTNPTSAPSFFSDCAEVARQGADGFCTGLVQCCVEYVDQGEQQCLCTDPTTYGYDSCEAMAEDGMATIVDICPRLLPDPGSCWPPNSCVKP